MNEIALIWKIVAFLLGFGAVVGLVWFFVETLPQAYSEYIDKVGRDET